MATLYVRKSGSDSNNYTQAQTPATAWLTINKALTSAVSGDTVYIGAGVYRETVTASLTSPTAETKLIGDVDGSHAGDIGEVRWTAYTTDDKTAPAFASTLDLAGRDFLTFENIVMVGGYDMLSGGSCVNASSTVISTNIKFNDCTFIPGSVPTHPMITLTGATNGGSPDNGIPALWTFDRCRFMRLNNKCINVVVPTSDNAYAFGLTVQNCLFIGGGEGDSTSGNSCINFTNSGFLSQLGGDFKVLNCTAIGGGTFVRSSGISTSNPCRILNCALIGCGNVANSSGEIVEDWNIIIANTTGSNVSTGSNTIADGSYANLFHIGQEMAQGKYGRPVMTPTVDSPFLARGGSSVPGVDILNAPRPAGPGVTWSVASSAVGCLEFGNSGTKETTTTRSAPAALRLKGPGYHDFDFPVDAASTTIAVYGRYDGSYGAATKPQMKVLNGTECGVANASVTLGGSQDTWTQMSLNFTPTAKGIVTIRLQSNTTSTSGNAYFDDFSVT
jgi:hypothetical protein